MVQEETRFPAPPPPSLPREAPWREIEEIIRLLRQLVGIYTGVAPTAPIAAPPIVPAPPELAPITSRLDALIVALVGNKPTFATGQKDVETAGEPEQLDELAIPIGFKLTIIAKTGNTGVIYLGKDKGDVANTRRRFDGLEAGLAVSLRVQNASAVWVDVSVDGEGVSWIVEQSR